MVDSFIIFLTLLHTVFAVVTQDSSKFNFHKSLRSDFSTKLKLVFLLISNLTNGLCLHQFLGTKTTEANKSLKTDANGAH